MSTSAASRRRWPSRASSAGSSGTAPPNCPTTPTCWPLRRQEVLEPMTAAQACRWQARLRDALDPALDRAVELAADLVPTPGRGAVAPHRAALCQGQRRDAQRLPAARPGGAPARVGQAHGGARRAPVRPAGRRRRASSPPAWRPRPSTPNAGWPTAQRRQRDTLAMLRRLVADRRRPRPAPGRPAHAGAAHRALTRPRLPRLPAAAGRLQLRIRGAHPQRHHASAATEGARHAQGLGRRPARAG